MVKYYYTNLQLHQFKKDLELNKTRTHEFYQYFCICCNYGYLDKIKLYYYLNHTIDEILSYPHCDEKCLSFLESKNCKFIYADVYWSKRQPINYFL